MASELGKVNNLRRKMYRLIEELRDYTEDCETAAEMKPMIKVLKKARDEIKAIEI